MKRETIIKAEPEVSLLRDSIKNKEKPLKAEDLIALNQQREKTQKALQKRIPIRLKMEKGQIQTTLINRISKKVLLKSLLKKVLVLIRNYSQRKAEMIAIVMAADPTVEDAYQAEKIRNRSKEQKVSRKLLIMMMTIEVIAIAELVVIKIIN